MHPDCVITARDLTTKDLTPGCAAVATEAKMVMFAPVGIEAEEDAVRVEVNPNICEGHGQCNAVAPEVYDLDDGGYCLIHHPEVPADLESQTEAGALACPVQAITVTR